MKLVKIFLPILLLISGSMSQAGWASRYDKSNFKNIEGSYVHANDLRRAIMQAFDEDWIKITYIGGENLDHGTVIFNLYEESPYGYVYKTSLRYREQRRCRFSVDFINKNNFAKTFSFRRCRPYFRLDLSLFMRTPN